MVQLTASSAESLKRPPPEVLAVLFASVLVVILSEPPLMPIPAPEFAVLLSSVLLVIVTVPVYSSIPPPPLLALFAESLLALILSEPAFT